MNLIILSLAMPGLNMWSEVVPPATSVFTPALDLRC